MRVVNHVVKMDEATYVPQHFVTIQISQEAIDDIALYKELKPGGLDMMAEFKQLYGEEFMAQVIQPLIDWKLKVIK